MNFQEECRGLQEKIARKRSLELLISDLRKQERELENKVFDLECRKEAEQREVDRMEARSLATLFYKLIRRHEEKLDKERQEAYAAAVKYDAAVKELEIVRFDLDKLHAQMTEVRGSEDEYRDLIKRRKEELKESGADGGQIIEAEEEVAYLKEQKQEILQAISAGRGALALAESVADKLDSAESWGTWDVIGGGLISDLAKHDALDEAQDKIEQLQIKLRKFQTELADIHVSAEFRVNVQGFLRFADYFFDGLIADWTVLDKIKESKDEVHQTISKLKTSLSSLEGLRTQTEKQIKDCEWKLDELVQSIG